MTEHPMRSSSPDRNLATAALCFGLVFLMIGAAYAAVPLYRLFCEVTGYGGTPQRAAGAPHRTNERLMTVEFDANIGSGLPWTFAPAQRRLTVRLGEEAIAYYRAVNHSTKPVTGQAVFNVTPDLAGRYFNKIQCFCFIEQTLQPGQSVDMPVVFYVDADMAADEDLTQLKTITLSYTFYPASKDRLSSGTAVPSADRVN
jgi:cytochrome c oxidase assembly protein subunit 11